MSGFYLSRSGAKSALMLPDDTVTRTFGIFGVKDSGKTTTGRLLAEGICRTGGHVCVLDPVGVHWGITRAGEGPGVPGIVIGGEHADVPLEQTGGNLVAEFVVGRHYPVVVIDMKLLRKGEAQRFMADFLEAVYFSNRRPLHLMFEEADRALPQSPRGMDPTLGRVMGAGEDIVKLGRSRGLGSTFISQRMATVTKNVTEQVEALILHAQPGPRDRRAVKEWVESNGDPRQTVKVMDSMASLDVGEAWIYSPKWLRVLERIKVRQPKTLDSSSTPTNDERDVEEQAPRAPVDLATLAAAMAETVKRAAANDPKTLRARIDELEKQLAERPPGEAPEPIKVFVPDRELTAKLIELSVDLTQTAVGVEEAVGRARGDLDEAEGRYAAASDRVANVAGRLSDLADAAASLPVEGSPAAVRAPSLSRTVPTAPTSAPVAPAARPVDDAGELSAGAAKLLDEMRGLHPIRLNRTQLAAILKRGAKSSTLTMQLGELKAAGAITDERGLLGVAGGSSSVLSTTDVCARWRSALPAGPLALLDVLIANPGGLTRADLFEQSGFSPTSSTPVTHLKMLMDNGLAVRVNGGVALGTAVLYGE